MKRPILFAFAFAGLAACDTPPSAPAPRALKIAEPSFAQIANNRFPIAGTLFNPCPPQELVAFEGFIHQVVTGEITPTSTDIKVHSNTQGVEGVGLTSGDKYRIIQNVKDDFSFSAPSGTLDETFDIRFRIVRQGSDDNLWLRQTVRITSPPFMFEIIRNEFECRG